MKQSNRFVIYWLLSGCLLIFLMVVIGGVTRLTHSGLSISDYKIITGVIPPITDTQWHEAFDLYKKHPEYQKINYLFSLNDFKSIYFWEWLHRLIGRLVGIVFFIPFLFFLIKKKFTKKTLTHVIIIGCLGIFQGFLGWYMVKSGLVNRPDVSHFRLASHLVVAFMTFGFAFWAALRLIYSEKIEANSETSKFIFWIRFGLIVLFLQIIWGGFVAGLDAGYIHNHWPMMNEGKFIHETVLGEIRPVILNFFEGKSGVQFIHRIIAYLVLMIILILVFKAKRTRLKNIQKKGIYFLLGLAVLQFTLGVFTVLYAVPLGLGLAHQIGAFFLLSGMIYSLHTFTHN